MPPAAAPPAPGEPPPPPVCVAADPPLVLIPPPAAVPAVAVTALSPLAPLMLPPAALSVASPSSVPQAVTALCVATSAMSRGAHRVEKLTMFVPSHHSACMGPVGPDRQCGVKRQSAVRLACHQRSRATARGVVSTRTTDADRVHRGWIRGQGLDGATGHLPVVPGLALASASAVAASAHSRLTIPVAGFGARPRVFRSGPIATESPAGRNSEWARSVEQVAARRSPRSQR